MTGAWVGTFDCWTHQDRTGEPRQFGHDPGTVVSVLIDPATNRPPDVGEDGQPTGLVITDEIRAACVRVYLCDECVAAVNADRRRRPFGADTPAPVEPGGIPWNEAP